MESGLPEVGFDGQLVVLALDVFMLLKEATATVGRSDTGVLVLTEREKKNSRSEGQTIQSKQKS